MKDNPLSDIYKEQLADISLLRQQISSLLNLLQSFVSDSTCELELDTNLWGEKENALSILVKLVGVITKVIPLEQELNTLLWTLPENRELLPKIETPEDEAIIERFIEKRMRALEDGGQIELFD